MLKQKEVEIRKFLIRLNKLKLIVILILLNLLQQEYLKIIIRVIIRLKPKKTIILMKMKNLKIIQEMYNIQFIILNYYMVMVVKLTKDLKSGLQNGSIIQVNMD